MVSRLKNQFGGTQFINKLKLSKSQAGIAPVQAVPALAPVVDYTVEELLQQLIKQNSQINERLQKLYIPRDGDVPFDVFSTVYGGNIVGGIPNIVGANVIGFAYQVPVGQKLIIQSYEFFFSVNTLVVPGGIDLVINHPPYFGNRILINGQQSIINIYQESSIFGVVNQNDSITHGTISPGVGSINNQLVNIIVQGGQEFQWQVVRIILDALPPPNNTPNRIHARFRGYLAADSKGRKDRVD